MNEDFLSKFRQAPRPEFTQSLYAKLAQDAKARTFIVRHPTAKRIGYALAVLCLALVLTITMSPSLRAAASAALDEFIAKITLRGMTVWVYDDFPVTSEEWERSESYGEIWRQVSPNDISAGYPFFAPLPTWIPSGYTLQERAALYFPSTYAEIPSASVFVWKDNTGNMIQLNVIKGSCPNGPFYNPDEPLPAERSDCTIRTFISLPLESEPQVIAINGQPALFHRGLSSFADLSDPVQKWNPSRYMTNMDITKGATVMWESEGKSFILTVESTSLIKEDLLRMAKSIP